ncbi:MAG TPA: amidohydrolase family protein [Thermomicrobiales bacterium]|nr:amidohydrolase family protein [Thermomicrobiales bacterium]
MTDQRPYVVDSHQHFWNPAHRDYPWLTDPRIRKPFGPEDLRPLLAANGVDATVLVQTVSDLDETREFLALAADTDFVAGVVGWADLTDPALAQTLAELRNGEHGASLVGIRHQVHDEEDPNWLLREDVQHGLGEIAEAGLVYDLLVRPRELPVALTVARDFPHLRFVIDHLAKPPIASGEIDEWSTLLHEFAGLENVACKLSGMVTEADPEGWTVDDLRPYVRQAVEIFGPHRLMFGSDWPVCLLAADYGRVLSALREALDGIELTGVEPEAAIFGGTAMHWYGLTLPQGE